MIIKSLRLQKRLVTTTVLLFTLLFGMIGTLYAATPWLHTEGNRIKDPVGNVVVLRLSLIHI